MSSELRRDHPSRVRRAPADRDYDSITSKRARLMRDEEDAPMPAPVLNRKEPLGMPKKTVPITKPRYMGFSAAKTTEKTSVMVETIENEEDQNLDPESTEPRPSFAMETDEDEEVSTDLANSDADDEEDNATGGVAEEEHAEEELGNSCALIKFETHLYIAERLQKEWTAPIYAFFKPKPIIESIDGRRVHVFVCNAKACKAKGKFGRNVRRYLDTGDSKSTSNLRRHAKVCWGEETIASATSNRVDMHAARRILKGTSLMRDGSITAAFDRTGKGTVTYSNRQLTKTETR